MIYVLLTYLLSPLLYLSISLRKNKRIERILIIQTAKIGDLVCSTPVIREVKRKYSGAHLSVLTNPANKELLEYNPHVNEILPIKNSGVKGFLSKLKLACIIYKGNYDAAICLNPNMSSTLAVFWGLVPIRLGIMPNFPGYTFRLASKFYTYTEKHVSSQLITRTYLKMLKPIGIDSDDISKEVYKSEGADIKARQFIGEIRKPLIGIAISSGNKLKELGAEKIIELACLLLREMDVLVVLIGSRQDRGTSENILNSIGKKERIINAAGTFSLTELPALLDKLSLFIGVDTGITYMTDALSIPIIHLAGPVDVSEQHPAGKNVKIIQTGLLCVPCTHVFNTVTVCKKGDRQCIASINVNEIMESAKALISRERPFFIK